MDAGTDNERMSALADHAPTEFFHTSLAANPPSLDQLRQSLAQDVDGTLGRLLGDFSICMQLADGRILLAVDRFARQGLCWSVANGSLQVASRADELAGSATPIDPQALYDYVYFHVIPAPRTIFEGVYRVPAGHCVLVKGTSVEVRPYWRPRFSPIQGSPDFEVLQREFKALLQAATARALGPGTAACYLSGGTDSSTVLGMVREATGQAPHAYSIGFDANGYDEMAYARIAAQRFGAVHHAYYVTPEDLLAGIPKVAAHYDQPFGNSSALPAYYCALRAKEDGVHRLLAGDGGDELFGGNERYAKQRVFGYYDAAPQWLRTLGDPLVVNPLADRLPIVRKAGSYVRQARVPLPDRLQTYNLLNRLGAETVFTSHFLSLVDTGGPAAQQRQVWQWAQDADVLDRNLAFDWRYTLAENDIVKVGGTAALARVEVAYPLLDDDLLAFSMRLPANYKLRGNALRWFFKQALRGFLPDEIITKSKHGFGLPFGVWMRQHPGLSALAADSLSSLAGRGIIQPEFVSGLLDQRVAEHAGYYGEMVWVLMMLEQWLRANRPDHKLKG